MRPEAAQGGRRLSQILPGLQQLVPPQPLGGDDAQQEKISHWQGGGQNQERLETDQKFTSAVKPALPPASVKVASRGFSVIVRLTVKPSSIPEEHYDSD